MVTIKDGCGCGTASCCSWKEKLNLAYARAINSINKIGDNDGGVYYPDGTGYVKLPLPNQSDLDQIGTNKGDIATLKADVVRIDAKDNTQDARLTDVETTDRSQNELIADNTNRLNVLSNELITTEASVAKNQGDIADLKGETQALGRSLVSDVLMTDGTTAGSVQVSIEREDGALITSANYRWGRDIGIRLEAGTQEGYVKAVIDLSDGTSLTSNEYKIVEVLESDVYVTAITLVPDMTAGTIGGNISYSNGTVQTINSVSVPTAPGVTSAIEALQGRMTAVENTNNTQSADITALSNRVQAIEDTPGVGMFGAGKLGTIAGSAMDGRVAAEDDGTGSVNGWSALKDRVSTAEGQIVEAQGDISDLDRLVSGKVDIMQGAANAGKALIVGADGNLSPGDVSGGEVWEEIDYSNPPTDWANGDRFKLLINLSCKSSDTTKATQFHTRNIVEGMIISGNCNIIETDFYPSTFDGVLGWIYPIRVSFGTGLGNNSKAIVVLTGNYTVNTNGNIIRNKAIEETIKITDFPTYVTGGDSQYIRLWRLKR